MTRLVGWLGYKGALNTDEVISRLRYIVNTAICAPAAIELRFVIVSHFLAYISIRLQHASQATTPSRCGTGSGVNVDRSTTRHKDSTQPMGQQTSINCWQNMSSVVLNLRFVKC